MQGSAGTSVLRVCGVPSVFSNILAEADEAMRFEGPTILQSFCGGKPPEALWTKKSTEKRVENGCPDSVAQGKKSIDEHYTANVYACMHTIHNT